MTEDELNEKITYLLQVEIPDALEDATAKRKEEVFQLLDRGVDTLWFDHFVVEDAKSDAG